MRKLIAARIALGLIISLCAATCCTAQVPTMWTPRAANAAALQKSEQTLRYRVIALNQFIAQQQQIAQQTGNQNVAYYVAHLQRTLATTQYHWQVTLAVMQANGIPQLP